MRPRCLCVLVLVLVVANANAGSKLTLQIRPTIALEPATVLVRTRVEADRLNRSMEVTADSEEYYRSSVVDMDGENAPTTDSFTFKNMPAGTYEIRVIVRDSAGEVRAVDKCTLIVASGR